MGVGAHLAERIAIWLDEDLTFRKPAFAVVVVGGDVAERGAAGVRTCATEEDREPERPRR
jgi:hypothetical protein